MAYDLIKQKFPGAPCAVGARVEHKLTGRAGNVQQALPGDDGVRVKFDGEFPPKTCHPREIRYLDADVVPLAEHRP